MTRLLLLVLALACLASCQAPYAFKVSVYGTYSDVEAPSSTEDMKFCYRSGIPCQEEQDIECACPQNLPSTGPMSRDPVNGFPQQFRWGTETQSNLQIPLPSGFGFRGTSNQEVATYESEFYVGRVAHFNNPITGNVPDRWTFDLHVDVTPYNQPTVSRLFSYKLELDETRNDCEDAGPVSGCPWDSYSYFAGKNPRPIQDTTCTRRGYSGTGGGSLNRQVGSDQKCCPYDTLEPNPPEPDQLASGPCADRIRHLDSFAFQSDTFDIDGVRYTMFLSGFRAPGSNTVREFFISQERGQTEALLYGRLIRTCPDTCPNGATPELNPEGTACVCPCTNQCPAPQIRQDDCSCICPPTDCGTGQVNPADCTCDCATANCPTGYIPDAAKQCECECQTCTIDLVALHGENAPCYTTECDDSTNGCVAIALPDGAPCTKTDPTLSDECYSVACVAGVCTITPVADGTSCDSATDPTKDPQCYSTECQAGVCAFVGHEEKQCSDGNPCTSQPGVLDPLTGEPTDLCKTDAASGDIVCVGVEAACEERACFTGACVVVGGAASCVYTPLPYGTECDDSVVCTEKDVCQQESFFNKTSGQVEYRPTGECRGQVVVCADPENLCLVHRCLESEGGCVLLENVKNGVACDLDNDNCTVDRCFNGTCTATEENICPVSAAGNTAAIIGGTVAAAAALLAIAAVVAIVAFRHAAATKVFDQTTWDVAGAQGHNSPLYTPAGSSGVNPLFGN